MNVASWDNGLALRCLRACLFGVASDVFDRAQTFRPFETVQEAKEFLFGYYLDRKDIDFAAIQLHGYKQGRTQSIAL